MHLRHHIQVEQGTLKRGTLVGMGTLARGDVPPPHVRVVRQAALEEVVPLVVPDERHPPIARAEGVIHDGADDPVVDPGLHFDVIGGFVIAMGDLRVGGIRHGLSRQEGERGDFLVAEKCPGVPALLLGIVDGPMALRASRRADVGGRFRRERRHLVVILDRVSARVCTRLVLLEVAPVEQPA